MSDQRREITLSTSTAVLLIFLTTAQCEMQRNTRRTASALDAHLCIEAAKAGVDMRAMPEMCQRTAKGTTDDQ